MLGGKNTVMVNVSDTKRYFNVAVAIQLEEFKTLPQETGIHGRTGQGLMKHRQQIRGRSFGNPLLRSIHHKILLIFTVGQEVQS